MYTSGRALSVDGARPVSAPGQREPEHVGQIVPGIGEQRDRIGDEAIARLDRDEAEVERDADRERAIEARGGVAVAVRMIVAHRRIATIVGARDTRTWRARSADRPARALRG